MFIYLSKKIAIPHGIKLASVSWNSAQGWIACGGANNLLKVLKLESRVTVRARKEALAAGGPAPQSQEGNLSMNQTLEGHNGTVVCLTWNEHYRKLTTSDQYGLIIVWMLHKGMWFEEMVNNRNKSVVKDMKWTADGQKICIVYEDGAVIVGSVDGNRLWGKELEKELLFVEWAPDGRNILFGTGNSEVMLYDALGNYISTLTLFAISPGMNDGRLIGMCWYNGMHGYVEPNVPTLAIGFDNGRVQIMRDDTDDNPVLIDTGINAVKMAWNTFGSVLAIAGTKINTLLNGDQKETQMVQFYSPFGKHLRTLKVPGSGIASLSWEGGSLRLALAVDNFIFFANIRPDYEWGYFSNTLVYSFNKPERAENCVCFWDTNTDERHIKYVKSLISIRAAGENCVFATKTDDGSGQFILILCNAIGSPVDSKYIDIEPVFLAMSPYHVIVASTELVYVWQYRTPVTKLTSLAGTAGAQASKPIRKEGRERVFHVDDPAVLGGPPAVPNPNIMPGVVTTGVSKNPTNDPICAVTSSKSTLIVARASGTLLRFSLPHLTLENKYIIKCRPQSISLNCDSTRLSIIDINGVLTLFDLDAKNNGTSLSALNTPASGSNSNKGMIGVSNAIGVHLDFERKDIWDLIWSDDNPELFACMEKTRMYVFRGLNPEEPVQSSGYLCAFSDLCIKAILMDEIIVDPEHPDKELVVNFETKSLRDTRELLATVPISEAYQFIEDNPHPRLWKILAESALEQLNFLVADKAFVRCSDYQGIQFVKRLKLLNDRNKQRAEVCIYFRRFDEAEAIYLEMDAKDLAVELRTRLGDWFRVVQLIQGGNAGDDAALTNAYNHIGDYYADRQKWIKAYKFYTKAKNLKQMVNCAYILDDYAALEKLVEQIPAGSDFLKDVGEKFASVGLCSEAVQAFLKADDPKSAIDCCVTLNQWDLAVELAEQHKFPQIETLLTKYASHLLQNEKLFQAVELYRKANKHVEAAKLLSTLAQQAAKSKVHPLRAKKLYVMQALQVDKYKSRMLDGPMGSGAQSSTVATLQSLLTHDMTTAGNEALEDAWHGAEAYHFFLLAQRQLYSGQIDAAMRTAHRLVEYEDILETKEIYSLIALTSFYNKHFGACSRAFIKLEALENVTKEEKEQYKNLALAIFTKYAPKDPASRSLPCPNADKNKCDSKVSDWSTSCNDCSKSWPGCIASGRPLINPSPSEMATCRTCKHRAYDRELRKFDFCPLCHSPLRREIMQQQQPNM